MSKNDSPFDHYSEKVFWLFVASVAISAIFSILSVVIWYFIAQGYMDSVKQIKIQCEASEQAKTTDVTDTTTPIFYWKG